MKKTLSSPFRNHRTQLYSLTFSVLILCMPSLASAQENPETIRIENEQNTQQTQNSEQTTQIVQNSNQNETNPFEIEQKSVSKTFGYFTPEQVTLNAMAANATKAEEYAKAERLFLASIDVGSIDVLWLNLGRTYAKQGKCIEAREAYNRVETAPVLPDSGIDVEYRLFKFRYELDAECAEQFARADSIMSGEGGFFTEEQILLNAQASEATMTGDYGKAELLFEANLKLGEFDITWLNLGRTYAKDGKCIEAREAYSHVLSAPVSREGANMKLESKLKQFQTELQDQCAEAFIEYDT